MNKFAIAAISAIALPLMTSQASAMWICQYFDNPTPSGRYDGNEISYKLAAEFGTEIEADNPNQEADARLVHATLGAPLEIIPDGAGQLFLLGAGVSSDSWNLRDHMGSASFGQKNLNMYGGSHSFTYGWRNTDWNAPGTSIDITGRFYQFDGSCFFGNDFIGRAVVGTMERDDGFAEVDVDYFGASLDYFYDDYTKWTLGGAVAESDDATPQDGWELRLGVRWQLNPEFPVLLGADITYAEVDDGIRTQDVTTIMFSVALMGIGNNTDIVPTQREFEHHSTHFYGWNPGISNQVR